MTYDELMKMLASERNLPARLVDGSFALLIRWDRNEAGFQVPGEEDMRWVALTRLADLGNGALQETPDE